jgi:hypothetical protein
MQCIKAGKAGADHRDIDLLRCAWIVGFRGTCNHCVLHGIPPVRFILVTGYSRAPDLSSEQIQP